MVMSPRKSTSWHTTAFVCIENLSFLAKYHIRVTNSAYTTLGRVEEWARRGATAYIGAIQFYSVSIDRDTDVGFANLNTIVSCVSHLSRHQEA